MISEPDRLEALERRWLDLWRRCPAATPFQSPGWLIAWWRAFSPGELATIAVWRGMQLVGFAPFYREESTARLLPVGISLSDYLDVLIDPDCAEAGEAIVEAAGQLAWSRWEMEELRDDADSWRLPCPPCAATETQAQSPCPVLTLAGGFETSVPPRRIARLRHDRARAERRGSLRIETASDAEGFLDILFDLHRRRWNGRGEGGLLAGPEVQAFHRISLPKLMAKGIARCFVASIGGRVAAAHYGFQFRGEALFYIGGFDPEFAEQSPGAILVGHAIAEAVREGAQSFHFLRGPETYKYAWGAVDRWNRRRSFVRRPA